MEILYFVGCPNHKAARALVERVAEDLGSGPEIRPVEVETPEDAQLMRFLGSPTIRVDGRDVEPGSETRTDFSRSCRVYRSDGGFSGEPAEAWVRAALAHSD